MNRSGLVLGAGLLLFLLVAGLCALFDSRVASDGAVAALLFGGAMLGGVLVWLARDALAPRHLLLALLLIRAVFWCAEPVFSDDIYRYVHEGRASRLGLATPYATPPSQITPLPDDGVTARVNHPDIPAAYPPLSQLVFVVVAWVGDKVHAPLGFMQLFFALCDLLVVWLLYRRRERRRSAWLVYALHPLPLIEAVWSAHLDILGVALVVAGALLLSRAARAREMLFGAFLIGLACGVKPIAIFALLAQPLRSRNVVFTSLVAIFGMVLPAVPYLLVDAPITSGLAQYSTRWEAQPTGYAFIEGVVEPSFRRRHERERWTHLHLASAPFGLLVDVRGETALAIGEARPVADPLLVDERLVARLIAGALLLIVLGALLLRHAPAHSRVAWAFGVLWLLAPTVHPWYFLWVLPFAALSRTRAFLFWAAAAPLTYEVVLRVNGGASWSEATWPRVVGLVAFAAGLAWDLWTARESARQPARAKRSDGSAR